MRKIFASMSSRGGRRPTWRSPEIKWIREIASSLTLLAMTLFAVLSSLDAHAYPLWAVKQSLSVRKLDLQRPWIEIPTFSTKYRPNQPQSGVEGATQAPMIDENRPYPGMDEWGNREGGRIRIYNPCEEKPCPPEAPDIETDEDRQYGAPPSNFQVRQP